MVKKGQNNVNLVIEWPLCGGVGTARLDGKKVKYNLFAAQQHTISTSGHFFTQSQKGKVHAVFTIYVEICLIP